MVSKPALFRFAPTPSGFLHVGNGINLVLIYVLAQQLGGKILLRIDDLDADRKRPEYVDDVFRCIDYLGLSYDIGPTGPDDFERAWSQHHRREQYEETLRQLQQTGTLFACQLSRKQLLTYGNRYPSDHREMGPPLDTPDVAWRVRVDDPAGKDADLLTDFVVRRRDGLPAYQVASLTDDVNFGVTHLVRGQDLYPSTQMQGYLAKLLSRQLSTWAVFLETSVWHHPLVLGDDGQKLAKSRGSTALKAMKEAGIRPSAIYQHVARLIGLPYANIQSLADLQHHLTVDFHTVK